LYEELLAKIDFSAYNKSIIIKGCSQKPVPTRAYVWPQYLQPMPVALCTAKLAQPFRYTKAKKDELKHRYEKSLLSIVLF
jgi:hypothetical protein